MKFLKFGISLLILLFLIISLNTKFGSIPPLGKFFDPDAGFWANAETSVPESDELDIPGLQDIVNIYFDERRVPHIFANNDHDLYYAQGYLTARDRLFQMELQTFDAGGRLAEKIGPGENDVLLKRDIKTRHWGMPYGAERAAEAIKNEPDIYWLQAYGEGVNAYISSLDPASYPIEYKILDFAPEKWEMVKTFLLLKSMTRTLASGNNEDRTGNTLAFLGSDFIDTFFTRKPKVTDPIIPKTTKWNFKADIPSAPDSLFIPSITKDIQPFYDKDGGIGSNNWAVSGSKTKSGYTILANDPHLSLTLPSIWYEIQLHAPGVNTYGVSLQGVPGIIIGFNNDVAWGVTNVSADVMDWYEITFKDTTKKEYWYDGKWNPTTYRIEEIKVRGRETLLDTMIFTHHGPVTEFHSPVNEKKSFYHALRWIAHDPSQELKTFYMLNRAANYDDYVKALRYYSAPAQNFVFASKEGDIALWANGKLPKKWKFQGRMVGDGSDPAYDWQGWIPHDQNPHVKNPPRGFVSSANQESAAEDYPYYLDDDFASFERGARINQRLAAMDNITKEDMQNLQMDDYSLHAAGILPELIGWVAEDSLSDFEAEIFGKMKKWDFYNDGEAIEPAVFSRWWKAFYGSVFNDEFAQTKAPLRNPSRDIVIEVLKEEPDFAFIDNINTSPKETLPDLATISFKQALAALEKERGEFGENWKWGWVTENDINHLGQIPGMGAQNVFTSGGPESVNATRGGVGPSWRMVVELGPEVKGWGVYPGGASGNPGSPNYTEMIDTWRTGGLFELEFMKEKPNKFLYALKLKPKE